MSDPASGARWLAALRLVRWQNALLAVLGVLLGAWWADASRWATRPVAWTTLVAVALTVALNVANDLHDVEIDRVAHPERPLPSGALSTRDAVLLLGGASLVAALGAWRAGGLVPALSGLVLAVGVVYSPVLKARGVLGNVVVALVASLPFLFGAEAVGNGWDGLALVVVAAPLHLARELAKDLDDAAADAGRRRTLPVTAGAAVTRRWIALAVALWAVLVTLLFAAAGARRLAFLPAVLLALVAAARAGRATRPRAATVFKLAMLVAMAALPLLR